MDTVYHYCSLETFLKIVESHTIKFSDVTKSNDSQEIDYLWNSLIAYYRKKYPESFAATSTQFMKKQQFENTDFLVSCFSCVRDKLHMWNCYGNEGVAIGFNKEKLKAWSKKIAFYNNGAYYSKNNDENEFVVADSVMYYCPDSIKDYLENICANCNLVTDNFSEVFKKAPLLKTDFWKEEEEWRIVIPMIYLDSIEYSKIPKDAFVPNIERVKISVDDKFGYKSYCCIEFEPNLIEEIILAPNCKVNAADIQKILKINGYDGSINISNSCGSLR